MRNNHAFFGVIFRFRWPQVKDVFHIAVKGRTTVGNLNIVKSGWLVMWNVGGRLPLRLVMAKEVDKYGVNPVRHSVKGGRTPSPGHLSTATSLAKANTKQSKTFSGLGSANISSAFVA